MALLAGLTEEQASTALGSGKVGAVWGSRDEAVEFLDVVGKKRRVVVGPVADLRSNGT